MFSGGDLNATQHLLEQMSVKLTHTVLSENNGSWTHTSTCAQGLKIYSVVSGSSYLQIEGSDRWNPLESGDVVLVFSTRPHTIKHHPSDEHTQKSPTRILCMDVELSKEDLSLLLNPLPNSVTLRNIVFETLDHETEMEYLVRIFTTLMNARSDLTGLLRAWSDEICGAYVQQLWNSNASTDRLPSKQLELLLGMSEMDFKARLRLRQSRELLHNTDLEIPEISAKLGFTSDEVFIRDFFDRYGTNPMVYRVKKTELGPGVRSRH